MSTRTDDWELLGLEPGADIAAVRRAYRSRRALYEPDALATYNLLEEDERARMVARLDAAYERIVGAAPAASAPTRTEPIESEPQESVPSGPPPDSEAEPGGHLRYHRLRAGVTLHHVSAETKISVAVLEHIESEAFHALPPAVFVRGHVQQFARELRLADADEIAKHFVAKMQNEDDVSR